MALQKAKNKQKKCGTIKSHISFLYFIFLFKPPKNIASTNRNRYFHRKVFVFSTRIGKDLARLNKRG